MSKGFFGNWFDINHDGELDGFEKTMDYLAFEGMTREDVDEEDDHDDF